MSASFGIGRISPAVVLRFATGLLSAAGAPADAAAITAECLVDADLRDLPSHGIMRLPIYLIRMRQQLISPACAWSMIEEGPAFALIDAGHGLGPVAATQAMTIVRTKARVAGVALCLIRNASHFGAAGYYTRRAAENGFIGVALSNSAPLLSLPGSRASAIGNNPISIAFPGTTPLVVDLALSAGALGRILLARNSREPIPADWALDGNGTPTDDAAEAVSAMRLQPIGGTKGFVLALAIEALTGVLSGSDFGTLIGSIYKDFSRPQSLGQAMIAINPGAFMNASDLQDRMDALASMLKMTGNTDHMPGERSERARRKNLEQGINLQPQVIAQLTEIAKHLEVGLPAELAVHGRERAAS